MKKFLYFLILLMPTASIADEANLTVANNLFLEKNYSEALNIYQGTFQSSSDSKEAAFAIYQIGECYRNLEDWEMANRAYLKLVTTYPTSEWSDNAYLTIANRILAAGRERSLEARTYFETIITQYPNCDSEPAAWLGLSKAREYALAYDGAEEALVRLIAKFPSFPMMGEAYYQLGQLLANPSNPRRNLQMAVDNFRMVVEKRYLTSQMINAYFTLANLYWELKQYDQAIANYRNLVQQYPDSFLAPLALTNIGLCYTEIKANSKAVEAYQELLDRYSQPPAIYENIHRLIEKLQTQEKDRLQISAWSAVTDAVNKKSEYEGDVNISIGKTLIVCDRAEVNLTTNKLIAEGNVRLTYDVYLSITSKRIECDLTAKTAMAKGDANLTRVIGTNIHKEGWSAVEVSLKDGASRGYSTPMNVK